MSRNIKGILCAACVLGFAQGAVAEDWDGFYGGLHTGLAYSDFKNNVPATPGPIEDAGSVIAGFQIGYNWTSRDYILGVEADLTAMEQEGDSAGGQFSQDLMYSLRVRGGKEYGENLIYGTLGVAWTKQEAGFTGGPTTSTFEPGILIGGGVERFFLPKISGRAEVVYVDAPKTTQNPGGGTFIGGSDNIILKLGVNFHF